jgi:hypothetical protein
MIKFMEHIHLISSCNFAIKKRMIWRIILILLLHGCKIGNFLDNKITHLINNTYDAKQYISDLTVYSYLFNYFHLSIIP